MATRLRSEKCSLTTRKVGDVSNVVPEGIRKRTVGKYRVLNQRQLKFNERLSDQAKQEVDEKDDGYECDENAGDLGERFRQSTETNKPPKDADDKADYDEIDESVNERRAGDECECHVL